MDTTTQVIADLKKLLDEDKVVDYSAPIFPTGIRPYKKVGHEVEPWFNLINIINNGKLKIAKPKVGRICQGAYIRHYIDKHYITQSASLSYKGKKVNLHHPADLDFGVSSRYRSMPNVARGMKCEYIQESDVRDKVLDYIVECCEPNLSYLKNEYDKAWQNTVDNAKQIMSDYFNLVGGNNRARLRENLAKFLKDSNFIEMNDETILTLLSFPYGQLELFANFIHRNRQDAVIATAEDIETAKSLAKVMQVQDA